MLSVGLSEVWELKQPCVHRVQMGLSQSVGRRVEERSSSVYFSGVLSTCSFPAPSVGTFSGAQ